MDLLLRALPSASNITGLTLGPHTVPEIDPDFPELDDDATLDDFHGTTHVLHRIYSILRWLFCPIY